MAILYVFKINDPNDAGYFPPSVQASTWFENTTSYFLKNSLESADHSTVYTMFQDSSELNSWIAAHTLSDPALLADVAAWKSEHGVSYTNQYFDLSADGGTYTPIIS